MKTANRFVPARLSIARKRRQLNKTQFAELVGVSTRMVTDYEAGRSVPSDSTLITIAEVLDFNESWFVRESPPEISMGTATFRALSRLTARQRAAAVSAGVIAVELEALIESWFDLPSPDLGVESSIGDPEDAANALRIEWGIGQRPVSNMLDLLESHGVRVFSLAEKADEVDAFSWWHDGTPFVFLNMRKSPERSRFDAAHELAHLAMHRSHKTPTSRDAEYQADQFASAFLMPSDDVLAVVPNQPTLNQLIELKQRWKVSAAALAHRSHRLGLLSEWGYRSVCIEIRQRGFHKEEPMSMGRHESSQLLGKVVAALRDEGTTVPKIASQLGVHSSELNQLLFGLAISVVQGSGEGGIGIHESHLKVLK